jgi:squalene-hopene/tetraprenyl-beta-curcumene cyclase
VELSPDRLRAAYHAARAALLAERTPDGHWVGELSSSALSTATAVSALALVRDRLSTQHSALSTLIAGGLNWLTDHQNADGGWGDTVKSVSNISTTMLGRSAFHIAGAVAEHADTLRRADAWLAQGYGSTPAEHAEAVRRRYGKDRTFSVPILMTSALAGLVDWREVPALPFELACLPQSWYRFARLPVVSYALPALIAIGQAVYYHRPSRSPLTRLLRRAARGRSLKVLRRIQPSSGGFLEATPLTSFVVMSLASLSASGAASAPRGFFAVEKPRGADAAPLADPAQEVIAQGVAFLVNSVRPDGSWPIDTNLATWVTTLAINALAAAGDLESLNKKDELREWLLRQQYTERHPYTGAEPGGWAWTDLPGGVPDADDTPGALVALSHLDLARGLPHCCHEHGGMSVPNGLDWLIRLQNADGGWPTFCRGWTGLPFDRSGSDLTAHVLRTLAVLRPQFDLPVAFIEDQIRHRYDLAKLCEWTVRRRRALDGIQRPALAFLARQQRPDGSWLPLWFGNQHAPDDENPTYGTARVLAAYRDLGLADTEPARRGAAWLLANQNDDGGWGGGRGTPSSVEETALAVEVLLDLAPPDARSAVERGLSWLVCKVEAGELYTPSPIGFYFAKLWYFERLYPIIFSVAALGRACRNLQT